MNHVSQDLHDTCFLACLQSFLEDQGVNLDQREQVEKYPDVFDSQGAVRPCDIQGYLDQEFSGVVTMSDPFVEENEKIIHYSCDKNQTVFLGLEKDGEPSHYVRAINFGSDGLPLEIMDPTAVQMNSFVYYPDWEITTASLLEYHSIDDSAHQSTTAP